MSATHAAGDRRLALLGNARFRAGWLAGAAASTVRWLDMLVAGVYVFDLTGSAFQVALVTMLRMLPLALFGATAGVLIERIDRKRALLLGSAAMCAVLVGLALLAINGRIEAWHLHAAAFATGTFWVLDFSARRTMLADIVGAAHVGTAMSLESVTNNGTRLLGPLAGGLLLEHFGLAGAYLLGALLYAVNVFFLAGLPILPRMRSDASSGIVRSLAEGIRYVRGSRELIGLFAVTIVFNQFAFPCMTMVPVIGKEVLGLSAFPVGVLMSAEGLGAMIGALCLAVAAPPRQYRRLYVAGTVTFLLAVLCFSRVDVALLAGLCLFLAGLGGAAFASMQTTLLLLNAEPQVRGRVMGLLSMCIGTAPIGFAHVGLMAEWLGAPAAIAVLNLEGCVVLLLVLRAWPEIVAVQPAAATAT